MCGSSVVRFGGGFGQSFSFGDNIDTYIYIYTMFAVGEMPGFSVLC